MKALITIFIFMTVVGCKFRGSKAEGGTIVGDGGNSRPSTEQEIRDVVQVLSTPVLRGFALLAKHSGEIKDPRVKAMLARMVGSDWQPLTEDVVGSKYLLDADGPCPHVQPGHRDASTLRGQVGAPICFHVEQLKRLPVESLAVQLTAIAAHEHAHHFGFDEADASHLQNFMLEEGRSLIQLNLAQTAYTLPLSRISSSSKGLLERLNQLTEIEICQELGMLVGFSAQTYAFLADASIYPETYWTVTGAKAPYAKWIHYWSLALSNYCGPVTYPDEFRDMAGDLGESITVGRGDKVELRDRLEKLLDLINEALTAPDWPK